MKLKLDQQFIINNALHVIAAILILVVFHIVAKLSERSIIAQSRRGPEQKPSVVILMLAHIMYYTIFFIGVLLILRVFGVEIASIVAIVSAIGFTIGLSLQGALSDIASGILLTLFQVYEIGDVIQIGDTEGTVLDFKLIHTVIEELSTKTITIIPNRKMQESIVHNYTKQGWHYFIVRMLLSNANKNFDGIRTTLRTALKDTNKFPDVLQNIPHRISIYDMSSVGTVLQVRVPVTTVGDVGVKRGDIRNALRTVLEQNGVILIDPTSIAK